MVKISLGLWLKVLYGKKKKKDQERNYINTVYINQCGPSAVKTEDILNLGIL